MNARRFQEIKQLFLELRELSPELRERHLERVRSEDRALSRELERLLDLDRAPDDALDSPALGDGFSLPDERKLASEKEPDRRGWRLGGYRLLRVLGRGGMGVVYLAEQEHPRREVALKLLRSVNPSREALRRFHAEAQALGRLQHPGIAQIFEAGTARTPQGQQPFLALEHVDGPPLVRFAEAARLDVRGRCLLLLRTCEAVHHAHARGVLHCDLKPQNVLVDEEERPRIIDFGIAHVTSTVSSGEALGRHAGTLPYLSPELRPGGSLAPDVRADVYSLGVLMVELLWGERFVTAEPVGLQGVELPPLVGDPLRELEAIALRATRAEPEERLESAQALALELESFLADEAVASRNGGKAYRAALFARRNRGALLASLGVAALLTILLGAWLGGAARSARAEADREANRAQRIEAYLLEVLQTADATNRGPDATLGELLGKVGRDVGAVFSSEPDLEAGVRVTLSSIHRRNGDLEAAEREAVEAVRISRSALGEDHIVSLAAMNAQAAIALALGKNGEAEELLRVVLLHDADAAGKLRDSGMEPRLLLAETLLASGRFHDASTALIDYVEGAAASAGAEPYVKRAAAELHYLQVDAGSSSERERLLRDALESSRRVLGSRHLDTLAAANQLGHHLLARDDGLEEGRTLLEETLSLAVDAYGSKHPQTLSLKHNLACAYAAGGDWERAIGTAEDVLAARTKTLGKAHSSTLLTTNNVARFEHSAGRWEAAAARMEGLARSCSTATETPWLLGVFAANRGEILRHQERLAEAEVALREAVDRLDRALGASRGESPLSPSLRRHLLNARAQLGLTLLDRGDSEGAHVLFESVYVERVESFGSKHPDTLSTAHNLATTLRLLGQFERAERMLRSVLRDRTSLFGPAHPSSLRTLCNLAGVLSDAGRRHEALEKNRRLVELALENSDTTWRELPRFRLSLGLSLRGLRMLEEAERECRTALREHDSALGSAHPGRVRLTAALGGVLLARESNDEALELLTEAHERCGSLYGEEHPLTMQVANDLAAALEATGAHEEAGDLWVRALELREEQYGLEHPRTLVALNNYAFWLGREGHDDEALELFEGLVETADRALDPGDWRTRLFRTNLGRCLMQAGRLEDAKRELEPSVVFLVRHFGSVERVPGGGVQHLRELYRREGADPAACLAALLER